MTKFTPGAGISEEIKKFEYVPGGTNSPYIDQETTEAGRVSGAPFMQSVNSQILAEMKKAAKEMGENPYFFEQIFEKYNNAFWKDADRDMLRFVGIVPDAKFREGNIAPGDSEQYETSEVSYERLLGYARWWYSSKIPRLADFWGGAAESSGGGGGGGGGGRRGPSASDIRNQFDLDQLAKRTDDLFRAYLLDTAEKPRDIAKDYVEEMVRGRGEKKIDFDTFVLTKYIEKSPRYASIYRNKPEGMDAAEYLNMYHQQAAGVLRPESAEDAAIGAAQFGLAPEQFDQRLQRSNEYRTSSQFLQGLEGRMRSLKGVLKG